MCLIHYKSKLVKAGAKDMVIHRPNLVSILNQPAYFVWRLHFF